VALFGATGFIGRAVLEEALARGCRVTALVRDAGRLQKRGNLVWLARALAPAPWSALSGPGGEISLIQDSWPRP